MKKLGIPDDGELSNDDPFLRYFGLFRGTITDDSVKAMTALCGLGDDPAQQA